MFLRTVAVLLIAALAMQPAALATARPISRAEYEACQARDEQAFRTAIEALTQSALTTGLAKVDYPAVVAQEWRRVGLDQLIDKQVDTAIGEVREESSWGTLLQSLASREKAQQLATTAAERVYRSDAIKTALEDLATGVGKEVGRTLELSTLDAAEPALECLQAFLGPRYGSTVAKVVAVDAGKEFQIDPAKGGASVSTGAVLVEGREAIAGAAVLLIRRQISGMAARIGQRLVGSVLSRLVSVVAGGVGLALIAKDIWDFRHGVLPIIADEMKSQATKDKVEEDRDLARVPPRSRQGAGSCRAERGLPAVSGHAAAHRPAAARRGGGARSRRRGRGGPPAAPEERHPPAGGDKTTRTQLGGCPRYPLARDSVRLDGACRPGADEGRRAWAPQAGRRSGFLQDIARTPAFAR
jgi:hypothetical protein